MTSAYSSPRPYAFPSPSSSFSSSSSDNDFSFSSLFSTFDKFRLPMSAKVQSHLTNVYLLLFLSSISAALGALAHLYFHVGGALTHLLSFGLVIALASTRGQMLGAPYVPREWAKLCPNRGLLLLAFAGVQGASLGPLIEMALYIEPSIVWTSLFLTANIFACLSLSAVYLPRRASFAFGGILSSCLSCLFWLGLFSMFFPTSLAHNLQIWLGLLVFCGYIVLDSQLMIERVEFDQHRLQDAHIDDAMKLFTNLIAVFVRILIILLKSQGQKDKGSRRKSR